MGRQVSFVFVFDEFLKVFVMIDLFHSFPLFSVPQDNQAPANDGADKWASDNFSANDTGFVEG